MGERLAQGTTLPLRSTRASVHSISDPPPAVLRNPAKTFTDPVAALAMPGQPPMALTRGVWAGGQKHGVVYLELEIRQDLLTTPAKTVNVADRLCAALTELQVRTGERQGNCEKTIKLGEVIPAV